MVKLIALAFVGGGLGATLRFLCGLGVARWTQFPWATLIVNVLGSFVMGLLAAWALRTAWTADARVFWMTGILGGLTTFSSFSIETLRLAEDGRFGAALANIASNLVLGLLAVALGFYWAQGRS
jgi:fluoride exporter